MGRRSAESADRVLDPANNAWQVAGPADLYDVGTVSMVHRAMKTPENNLFVIIMGVSRVRIEDFVQFDPYLRARIRALPDEKEDETVVDFQALRRTIVSQFERIVKLSPQLPDDLQTVQGREVYVVRIALDEEQPAPMQNFKPKPGLPAEVYIRQPSGLFLNI